MKRVLLFLALATALSGCSQSKSDLYEITDYFVESLSTTYESYGIFNLENNMRVSPDGYYQVSPVGRLINVKILEVVPDETYEDLREDLENHYKGNKAVNKVYLNQGGTIMIDCRR